MKTLKSKISVLLFASILTLSSLLASDVFAQGTNIALNRPASASSIERSGLEPDKAVDGSTSSRWGSSFNDNQWIRIDLGQTYNITQVSLNWEAASGRSYLIETSNDDYNWVQIASRDNMTYGARVDNLTSLTGSGRYIRMYGRTRTTQYGFSLFEFSVYGTLPNYTLSTVVNPTAGGNIALSPVGGSYTPGTVVTLNPTPSAAYTFTGWSGDLSGSVTPASITMNTNKNVTANFSIKTFTISASTSSGGNISPVGVTNVTYGNSQLYTFTPASGYSVASVVVDGTPVTPVPASFTFSNVTAVHTIAVSFSAVNFTLTTASSPTAGGGVTLNPAGGSYASGTVVTLTPTPSVGYNFTGWSGDLSGSTSPSSITMNSNKNVTANFSILTFAISASASTGGSISPAGVTNVTYGNNQLYTFTPASGYLVTSVVVDGTPIIPVPASYTFSNVTAVHTIAVTFSGGTYTLTTAAIGNGTVSPASNTYPATTAVPITATPAAGWQFYRWDGDVSGSSNPVTIIMNANKTVTAIFTEITPTVPNSNKLSISSRLFDANGIPVGTDVAVNRNITIRLFDQQVGGNLLHTETFLDANHKAAIIDRGYFVVRLGEGTTSDDLLTTLGAHNNIWVEIQVESVTFVQRIPLTAAAYSLQ
jgi:uncharacterized repeat protein (TIGR02543 family)